MDFQNEMIRLQEMLNLRNSNQDPPIEFYDIKGSDEGDNEIDSLTKEPLDTLLMGDEVINTTPARDNDEFINSSVDDLVPIPRESEVTSVCDDLECNMPVNTPFPTNDVREQDFDINSPLGEQVVDFLMKNVDVAYLPRHMVKQLFGLLVKNLSSTKRMSDKPLEFEDISSLDLLELTPVIDESNLLVTLPLSYTDVLGDAIVDIDLLFGEQLDTLSTGDRETDFDLIRDIEKLEHLLADDLVPVPRVFDEPLGNSNLISRSFDVTYLNLLFDFDDNFPLRIDNKIFDDDFEDLCSLDPLKATPLLDESILLVIPLSDPKQICLREVERFDPFFSLTQSGGNDEGDGDPFFWFSSYAITPSCCMLTQGGDVSLLPSSPHIG
ncbi:hypothetical protein Tco_1234072 [Tanacetum coccineum]